ncbi:MAG: VanW family protein [Bacillota bacterium]
MQQKLLWLLIIICSLCLGLILGSYLYFQINQNLIFSGVTIEGYKFGGLTRSEAVDELEKLTQPLTNKPITLVGDHNQWRIDPAKLDLEYDIQATVNQALAVGRTGNLLRRLWEVWSSYQKGYSFKLSFDYNHSALRKHLTEIAAEINQEPQNAYLNFLTGRVISSSSGRKLALEESKERIINRLANLDQIPIYLAIEEEEPQVTTAKLEEWNLTKEISSYSTKFNTDQENRSYNIKLASQKINGTLLQPGEVFSFNQVVGERTLTAGFKKAPELVNQELVMGVGGGVCQVSSTLYNAVLLGVLAVVERQNHSRPVDYVSLGRGATVYNDYLDFKFKNNFDNPVMILSQVHHGQLQVKIMGKSIEDYRVEIATSQPQLLDYDRVKKESNNLSSDEKQVVRQGKKGYRVTVRRKIYQQGQLMTKEIISQDIYQPVDEVIKVPATTN